MLCFAFAGLFACSSDETADGGGPSGGGGTASSGPSSGGSGAQGGNGADGGGGAGGAPVDPWSCKIAPYERAPWSQPADDSVAFESLIEAAGYAGPTASDWVDVAAANLCGGDEPEMVLVKNAHSNFSILGGPTPHAIGSGDLSSNDAHPWRGVAAADLDGTGAAEVIAVRQVTAAGIGDLVVASANDACALSEVTSEVVGGPGASDWIDVTTGDLDGDGELEIIAARAPGHVAIAHYAGGALTVDDEMDVPAAEASGWQAVAAGDLDGDGKDELVVARSASNGAGKTMLVYQWNGAALTNVAWSTIGNNGNSDWAGLAVADFNGDGRASIAMVKDSHSSFILFDVPSGAPNGELAILTSSDLATAPGQGWRGLAAADWSGGDDGAAELVAVRRASGDYRADIFVHGSAWHRALRDTAVAKTKAQYANEPRDAEGKIDVPLLLDKLAETHATTYSFLLWDETGQDYLDLVEFLEATRDHCVDEQQLRVWVTLIPPTEHVGARCSQPADSPLTSFDEASFFGGNLGEAACEDYAGWGALLGALAKEYPQLVAVNVDDMTHNIDTMFTPELVASMESGMRGPAPWMSLVPTFYYSQMDEPSAQRWPDVGLTLDSILFYFRNQKEGEGPCSACETPQPCPTSCLADTCAEQTVGNFPGEANEIAAMLPAGRPLQIGIYFSGHSACGTPSAKYDYDLLEATYAHPRAGGATVYVMQSPGVECVGDAHLSDKGCAVQKVFGAQ